MLFMNHQQVYKSGSVGIYHGLSKAWMFGTLLWQTMMHGKVPNGKICDEVVFDKIKDTKHNGFSMIPDEPVPKEMKFQDQWLTFDKKNDMF